MQAATASRFSEGQLQEAPASSSEFGKPSPPKKRISRVSSSTLPPDVPLVPQVLSSKDTAQPAEADLSTSAKSSPNRAESSVSMKSPNAPSKSPGLSLEAKDSQTQSNVSDRENLAGENATISASNATLTAVEPPDVPEEKVGEDVEVPESSRAATHSRSVSLSGGLENSNNSMPNTSDAVAKAIREAAERAGDPGEHYIDHTEVLKMCQKTDPNSESRDSLQWSSNGIVETTWAFCGDNTEDRIFCLILLKDAIQNLNRYVGTRGQRASAYVMKELKIILTSCHVTTYRIKWSNLYEECVNYYVLWTAYRRG